MKILLSLFLLSHQALASITLKSLDFKKTDKEGFITVAFDGKLGGIPELEVHGEAIQVLIPDSKVKSNMEKTVSFSSKLKDTQLRAYQTTQSQTKIKALLPFNIAKKRDLVSLKLHDDRIELTFPRVKKNLSKVPVRKSILKTKKKTVKKEFLNEAYLNNLLKIEPKKVAKKNIQIIKPKPQTVVQDQVKTQQAVQNSTASGQDISLIKYGGKFAAFLGLVLLLFYGIVSVMKKGFFKKGKLGFLGSTDKIMVLNQHYIAPKKSLMLIKAHNQVFLVSNTDSGIHPISEIKDVAGLIKDEEKTLVGHNFDTKLQLAEINPENDQRVKMKEDISESNKASSLSSYNDVKDRIKFSDQIKEKVKGLKSFQ